MQPLTISSRDIQEIERCFFWGYFLQIHLHKYSQYVIPSLSHIPQTVCCHSSPGHFLLARNSWSCWLPAVGLAPRFVPKEPVLQVEPDNCPISSAITLLVNGEAKLSLLCQELLWLSSCSLLLLPTTSEGWAEPCFPHKWAEAGKMLS